jgi:putative tryptophan/tyrosine transport system substrate-binding protein
MLDLRRRQFVTLLGGAAVTWPLAARAQQPAKVPKIGYLGFGPASAYATRVEALRVGLRDLGWVEGRNIVIEFRWAEGVDQLPALAAELVRMNVDVIFASSSTLVEPARQATQTIPIVFSNHADPVGIGHVASLARPGGNVTGLSMLLTDLAVKELEILTEAVPQAKRIGVLWNPTTPSHVPAVRAVEDAGEKLRVNLVLVPVRAAEDFDTAFATMVREGVGDFLVVPSPLFTSYRAALADLALKHRLPGMFGHRDLIVDVGALMSYGADIDDLNRRASVYIDKILRGAKPSDLPVEQASKYQLVINLKTAKALGLEVPPTLLARADEVIE